jgi:uncharacterized protein RhaS with RHS repeats
MNMRTTRLIAVLVGLAAIAMVAADAKAYYHPGMGRFMSRDPGAGNANRIGAGGPAVGGGFIPRDPTGSAQYADGMNLYQYVRGNPNRFVDPSGNAARNPLEPEESQWTPVIIDPEQGTTVWEPTVPTVPPFVNVTDINDPTTEVMTDATVPGFNNTYKWNAAFKIYSWGYPSTGACSVTFSVNIKPSKSLTRAVEASWRKAITDKFHNKCEVCCSKSLPSKCGWTPIRVEVHFVSSGQHHEVTVQQKTVNMGQWGTSDPANVAHEFGHMLGLKDEYYTIDGAKYGEPYQKGGNVMNNPPGPVADHQCNQLAKRVGTDCKGRLKK